MNDRIVRFRELSIERWKYLNDGDSKNGNKCYDELLAIARELRIENKLQDLDILLDDENDGVKFEAGTKLLTINSKKAEKTLEKLTEKKGTLPFTVKMTLKTWRAGNLSF